MRINKKIILILTVILAFAVIIGLYYFLRGSGSPFIPGARLRSVVVHAVEAATGTSINNATLTIEYECRDSLNALTFCVLSEGITDAAGQFTFNEAFVPERTYTLYAKFKAGRTFLGRRTFVFTENGEKINIGIMGPMTTEMCSEEVYGFDKGEIRVLNHVVEDKNAIRINIDKSYDRAIRIKEIDIIGFGNLINPAEGAAVVVRNDSGLKNGCYKYPVKIIYEYSGITDEFLSTGSITGAFWE